MLKEFGLSECTALETCISVMDSLRMRQLDKLKVLLSRVANDGFPFPPDLVQGIRKNDPERFAKAILLLNSEPSGKG